MDKVAVSVCVFTFNYELYIAQCLDSILTQETNFDFEVIVGDDFSTDKTRDICTSYAAQCPNKIKLSFNEKNIGGTNNWLNTLGQCKGKYIALIDGDDYFTEKNKLQLQFDAMEADKQAVLCFHDVLETHNDSRLDFTNSFEQNIYTNEDFFEKGWFIRTASMFFKNGLLPQPIPTWVHDYPYRFDTIMQIMLNQHGHTLYLPKTLAVWRRHNSGMSKTLLKNIVKNHQNEIAMWAQLDSFTEKRYTKHAKDYQSRLYAGIVTDMVKNKSVFNSFGLFCKALLNANKKQLFSSLTRKLS